MTSRKEFDTVVMAMLIVSGVTLLGLGITAQKNVHQSCTSKLIRDGWVYILTFGACLVTAGISYFLCVKGEGANCYNDEGQTIGLFIIICMLLASGALFISILMALVYKNTAIEQACDTSNVNKRYAGIAAAISGATMVGCGAVLAKGYWEAKNK